MAHISKTPAGKFRANWRDPSGRQCAKTFTTKREATAFLAQLETAKNQGSYVSPHAGRLLFSEHAQAWMATRRTEKTTAARDESVMRTHVLAQWGSWPLNRIDELSVQTWVTTLAGRRSHAVASKALQLTSGVLRSAVRNRLIGFNPCEDVTVPAARKRDTDGQVIEREVFRDVLLPHVPERHRAVVCVAAGAGLRWGEAVGLCVDALDLDAARLSVLRTVVEVDGHTSFKPYPKSAAGRRTIPLPGWLVDELRRHTSAVPAGAAGLVFPNEVGAALRRSLFRSRVWRPALVRAGLLGAVSLEGDKFAAEWTDADGGVHRELVTTHAQAVKRVAAGQDGGLRYHDLRHSYSTWLIDDGVPPNMVARVLGHERITTTLEVYTRRTDDASRILRALTDDGEDDGAAGTLTPC